VRTGLVYLLAAAIVVAAPAGAQDAAGHIALGDSAHAALDAAGALAHYERAIGADSMSYEALWKASRDAVDLGEGTPEKARRTELYRRGEGYARRAVNLRPDDAEAHFHLARAVGVAALALGVSDRVKYATLVRQEALRALELDPKHPGALHVMGMWNAEVMRLSGLERMVAKTFLGGRVFEAANWADAIRYMEEAVAVDPGRLTHRLDLARIYRDRGEKAKAREQYEAVIRGPATEFNDRKYIQEATAELARLK
jgi:tetratricopeptide (TPR) repeat protein